MGFLIPNEKTCTANQGVNLLCREGNSQPGHWMKEPQCRFCLKEKNTGWLLPEPPRPEPLFYLLLFSGWSSFFHKEKKPNREKGK